HDADLIRVADHALVCLIRRGLEQLQFADRVCRPDQPEFFRALMFVEDVLPGLDLLPGGDLRLAFILFRGREEVIESDRALDERAFVEQVQKAWLRAGEIEPELPAVLKNLLTR